MIVHRISQCRIRRWLIQSLYQIQLVKKHAQAEKHRAIGVSEGLMPADIRLRNKFLSAPASWNDYRSNN